MGSVGHATISLARSPGSVQTGFDSAAFLRFLAPRADSWLTQTLHETTPRQHHHDFTISSEPDSLVTILTSLSS